MIYLYLLFSSNSFQCWLEKKSVFLFVSQNEKRKLKIRIVYVFVSHIRYLQNRIRFEDHTQIQKSYRIGLTLTLYYTMIRSILPGGRTAKSVGAYLRNLGDSFESLGLSFQSPLGNKDTRTFSSKIDVDRSIFNLSLSLSLVLM